VFMYIMNHLPHNDDNDNVDNDNDDNMIPVKINDSHRTAITSTTDNSSNAKFTSSNPQTTSSSSRIDPLSNDIIIYPPMSRVEEYRDIVLRIFDSSIFQYIGVIVLLGVIVSGALFFFLLVGIHSLCHPVTDCEPRNGLYNISIQILNGFFTYMAIISLPWRLSNFFHVSDFRCGCFCCCSSHCYPIRCNDVGHNVYGLPDPDIWFHIPVNRRLYITIILLLNCLFQFINHGTRIENLSYAEQDGYPGNVWTNVFFVAAFVCAGIGAIWILYETSHLRKVYPDKFGYGPINVMKHWYHQHFIRWFQQRFTNIREKKKKQTTNVNENIDNTNGKIENVTNEEVEFHHHERIVSSGTDNGPAQYIEQQQRHHHVRNSHGTVSMNDMDDPTRAMNHPTVLLEDRGAMRMFGL
jgi:Protein of unknown function (DUF2985)